MSGNIVSFVIDGIGGIVFACFPDGCGWGGAILAPVILHNVKKNNE